MLYEHGCLRFALDESVSKAPRPLFRLPWKPHNETEPKAEEMLHDLCRATIHVQFLN